MNVNNYDQGNNGRTGRQPDYVLKIGLKGQRYHQRCGAAWKIKNGGLAIRVDPGLALVSGTDVLISLWPNEPRQQQQPAQPQADDDQIPY